MAMPPLNDPVNDGVLRAQRRIGSDPFAQAPDTIQRAVEYAADILQDPSTPTPDPAVALSIELVAIAAAKRVEYDEEPLYKDQIQNFLLNELRPFMNSFFHE